MLKDKKILIVGGGIAGLSMAIALHQQGLQPELIEKIPRWDPIGAGLALPANAVEVMQKLGLYQELCKRGQLTDSIIYVTDQNELLCEANLAHVHPRNIPFIALHRADVHDILLTAAKDITIHLGTTITDLLQHKNKVQVTFSNGQIKEYDLLIAADGIHSQIRRIIFPQIKPDYLGIICWRYIANRPKSLPNSPIFYFGDNDIFLIYPINAEKVYCYGQKTEQEQKPDPDNKRIERFLSIFSHYKGLVPEVLLQLSDPKKLIPGWIETVEQDEWYKGRVLLVGDAAHACGPILQQGGAQSLEDAFVFAEVIKDASSIEEALITFKIRRLSRVKWVASQSNNRMKHVSFTDVETRNDLLRKNGPINIAGWKELFKTEP